MVFLHFEEQLKILFLKIPAPQNFGGGEIKIQDYVL